jgi:hypothetical protein
MNGTFQMQGDKNWILQKYINANRFFWVSHWLEIWSNHLCYVPLWDRMRERGHGLRSQLVFSTQDSASFEQIFS